MPARGTSRQTDRCCLVCAETTRIAHLGIDVCRACAVFYRRAKRGPDLVCRSTTGSCPTGKSLNCKKCRFDHIDRLLNQPGVPPVDIPALGTKSREHCEARPCGSPSAFTQYSNRSETPILDSLKIHYRTMSWARLTGELHSRPEPPHPLEISLERGPFFPATIKSLAIANRLLLTGLLEFATCVFPEFGQLENKEKWDIVVNNFYRFRLFEGCYRANDMFSDDLDKKFAGYTTWMSVDNMAYFYSDGGGDTEKAVEHAKVSTIKMRDVRAARELVMRVNPCREEFLVVFAVMFWSLGDMPVREEIARIGEAYSEAILKELHAFYREQMKIDDYAARLGQLMMFIPLFDRSKEMKEHFEVLNLIGVLPSDNFTYLLQKAD